MLIQLARVFRWIWLATLLAIFDVALATSTSAMTASAIAYDAATQGIIAYDEGSLSAADYDPASVLAGNERKTRALANYVLFVQTAESVAAKGAEQLEFGFVKNLENPNFVLYKSSEFNPSMLRPGEYTLNLPNLGSTELNWAQNQAQLSKAMSIGNPIREVNPYAERGFLQRERDFLGSGGWQRTQQGNDFFWVKPGGH